MTIDQTLADRGKTYGPFLEKAKTVQALIDVVIHEPGWERLAADQKQCIMVCFDKFARAIHGDPNHRDNFHDVVGYAKLVDDRMAADEAAETFSPAEQKLAEAAIRGACRAMAEELMDGWIEWRGGECPVPKGTLIDVKHRDGDLYENIPAGGTYCHDWRHLDAEEWNNGGDIIAYRLTPAPRT